MKIKGRECSSNQTGWVQICRRLIKVKPLITIGMIISELSRYPKNSGILKKISSAFAMIAASSAKNINVNEA